MGVLKKRIIVHNRIDMAYFGTSRIQPAVTRPLLASLSASPRSPTAAATAPAPRNPRTDPGTYSSRVLRYINVT